MELEIQNKEDWWTLLDLHWSFILRIISDSIEFKAYKSFLQRNKLKNSHLKLFTLENLNKFKEERNSKIVEFFVLAQCNLESSHFKQEELDIFKTLWNNTHLIC